MNEQRGNFYLLTGVALGLALGLLIAWVISPVKYIDTEPSTLAEPQKDIYRQVIAMAYQASGDLGRARQRIKKVDPNNSYQVLAAQAQRLLAENNDPTGARALAQLAADLNNAQQATIGSTTVASGSEPEATKVAGVPTTTVGSSNLLPTTPAQVAEIQTATLIPTLPPTNAPTPQPTFTPRPTSTPVRVSAAPFMIKSKDAICGPDATAGLLQIEVIDHTGAPVPGVPILITWQNGEETFYTGLIPEVDPGYADYSMAPEVVYRLKVGEVSEVVDNVNIPSCGGGWKIVFAEANQ